MKKIQLISDFYSLNRNIVGIIYDIFSPLIRAQQNKKCDS